MSQTSSGFAADRYYPDLAHRYLAVRPGAGHITLSGNLLTRKQGAAVILGATVSTAPLVPTPPLPPEHHFCDDCRLCLAWCPANFVDPKEETCISLGWVEFRSAKRRHFGRCEPVCSGYTGLHSSGKWSTGSPGRFPIPENDDHLQPAYDKMQRAHGQCPVSSCARDARWQESLPAPESRPCTASWMH